MMRIWLSRLSQEPFFSGVDARGRVLAAMILIFVELNFAGCTKKGQGSALQSIPPVQVIVVEAKRQPVSESLSLVGSLAANEMVEIKAEIEGVIDEINFKEGQRIEKGQALVKLDESKLAATLAEAEANFNLSKANHARAKQLLKDNLISQQEFEQLAAQFEANQASLELKKRQLKDARILAPFGGIIGARQVSPGQVISKNTTLTWLVDLDPVKVEVKVPERYLRQVKVGQPLEFTVAAFPAEKFHGEVYFISPQIDESTRTALVKARIANPEAKLRSGMFASLDLTLQLRDSAIVIPEPALMSNGDNFMVFVVDGKGTAQIRPIQVGLRLAGKAEVVKGLAEGEKVVVEGTQKLRPGAPVQFSSAEAAAPYLN